VIGRRSAVASALVVMAATLLVATRPADAAVGDTYTWVATGAGNFSDAANWTRASDGQHGVPGPDDAAVIVEPPGTVTVDAFVTVSSLTVEDAVEDGAVDLDITGQPSRLNARSVSLSGDSRLTGGLVAHSLTLNGTLIDARDSHIVLDADTDPAEPTQLVLDGATGLQEQIGFVVAQGSGPLDLEVRGAQDSTFGSAGLVIPSGRPLEATLKSDEGGSFVGRILLTGSTTLHGDVPSGALVLGGSTGANNQSTLTWSTLHARLDGLLSLDDRYWSAALPDDLTVSGTLDLPPTARGGDVTLEAGADLAAKVFDSSTRRPSVLDLDGTFVADPAATLAFDQAASPCVGEESVLVRAAGGVRATPTTMTWLDAPAGIEAVAVPLRHQLVAVARRTSGSPDPSCAAGASSRVVDAMYRDLLGRTGDAGGVSYWAGQLDGGRPGVDVAAGLLATGEARAELVRATWDTWSCTGTAPSDDVVAAQAEQLRVGGKLADLRAEVLTSTVPDGGDPVDCLYHAVLGRTPDAGGRAYAESRLTQESLARLARRYMVTSEGRRVQFNRLYQKLLGRHATPDEIAAGTTAVRRGQPETSMTAQIVGSDEYATRAAT
jgi:hypothetical protein